MMSLNKKSYSLLITIVLVSIFSIIGLSILQTKSMQNINLQNQYLYLQGENHKDFFIDYINSLNLEGVNHLKIKDDLFDIEAFIEKKEKSFVINIYIKAKEYNISIHEQIIR